MPRRLQERLGYTFRDESLLRRALTHPSYLQDHPEEPDTNQRLEFLGDAVLQLVLSETLFRAFPEAREGELSRRRAQLSNGAFFATLATELGLPACLRLSESEESTGGRQKPAALEDAFEALVGALYLDSDLPTVKETVLRWIGPLEARLHSADPSDNPKGRLQEKVQPLHGNGALRYESRHVAGEDHAREYESTVFLLEQPLGSGRGSTKKAAESAAARQALEKWIDPTP